MEIKKYINKLENELIMIRRYLHSHAEIGFELNNTCEFVKKKILEYGLTVKKCGRSGLVTNINLNHKKTLLLRAELDALPMNENTELDYASKHNMHACGHDLHTTFLLGLIKVLVKYKKHLKMNIVFMFQPAEELLKGAQDMIENGVLDNVNYALTVHVITNSKYKTGTIILPPNGVVAPSSDFFKMIIKGKSCHGAMPNLGIDPIYISSLIIHSLSYIKERKMTIFDNYILTYGSINGGNSYNIIPSIVEIKGNFRTFSENTRLLLKEEISNLSKSVSKMYNASCKIIYDYSAPTLINDENLYNQIIEILDNAKIKYHLSENDNTGSDDFSYISCQIPSYYFTISAGSNQEGYTYPLHNENVIFNENVITKAIYVLAILCLNIK